MPVSSSTYDRSFSTMCRINNYLRSTMPHNPFSDVGLFNVENDVVNVNNIKEVLNDFCKTERKLNYCKYLVDKNRILPCR